ncbi:outer membrane beta-barrel protein [Luteibaculum oceani]|uniref:PorT family protein n=1 Tax=Luteibaculum oceani TaxID=1294296 RepID=A0A5C6V9B0_9FLAO|nr:outer membrane beta-barrel protein [Luteibaculum oceani]TXC81759.1 PorT family protein [Luteibaculum oceani]
MKLIQVLVLSLFSLGLSAQQSGFFSGGRFMMGSSELKEHPFNNGDVNTKLLFGAGFNANYFFTEAVGVGTDVMLNFSGAKVNGQEDGAGGGIFGGSSGEKYTDKYNFIRLELPFLGKLSIPFGDFAFVAFAGPSFDFNLAGNVTREYNDGDSKSTDIDNMETITTSFKAGGGVQIANANGKVFMLDARISQDLSPFYTNDNNKDFKIGYFAFSIGVGF